MSYENPLIKKWKSGEPTLGGWLTVCSPPIAEYLAATGLDEVTADQQHSNIGVDDLADLLPAIEARGVAPVTRVGYNDPYLIGRSLDLGAVGVIIPMVNNAVEAVQCAAEAKAIDVDVAFDPHLGDVECDPNRIQQIIWNLLTNAIKFTPERGQVHLEVSHWPGQVAISVQDTGKGIAPGFLPHLFDRFRQEDGGIARKHGGLGLGLSIVKHLVELHGGTVEAHSAGEGQGSTFLVKLPRSPAVVEEGDLRATFARPARVGLAALDERSLWGVRVLGVDDDLSSRELLVRVLSDAGATVRAADSARSAWAMLDEFRPDVLISDVGMPEEDGLVFVKRLRATGGRYAQLPVVAVTAFGRPEDRDAALQAGFDEHMSKPFDPGLLCAMIRELAGGSGKPAVVPLANGISTGP